VRTLGELMSYVDLADLQPGLLGGEPSAAQPPTGYGTIAQRVGLTKARVQQIANAPRKPVYAAYAFQDEHGQLHGDLQHGMGGPLLEAPTFIPFSPADKYNPLAGQTLVVLHGIIDAKDDEVSAYTLQIRQPDGSPLNIRSPRTSTARTRRDLTIGVRPSC
jgi:hypothetical protein